MRNVLTYDFKWTGFDDYVKTNTIVGATDRYYQGRDMQSFNSGLIALDRRDLSVGATPTDTICDPFALGIKGDQVPTNCLGWEERHPLAPRPTRASSAPPTSRSATARSDPGRPLRLATASGVQIPASSPFDAPGPVSASKGDGTFSVSATYKLPLGPHALHHLCTGILA